MAKRLLRRFILLTPVLQRHAITKIPPHLFPRIYWMQRTKCAADNSFGEPEFIVPPQCAAGDRRQDRRDYMNRAGRYAFNKSTATPSRISDAASWPTNGDSVIPLCIAAI
jgi:hypothetical protein